MSKIKRAVMRALSVRGKDYAYIWYLYNQI
jgi:hypothetical protein